MSERSERAGVTVSAAQTPATTSSDPTVRVPRAPVSRRDTSATGRADRPDPCADPPTVTIDPTRVMPAVPGPEDLAGDPVAATVPRLRSVTPAGGGALGDGRVLAAASALGAAGSFAAWLLAARTLPPDRLGAAVAVVAVVAVASCVARPDRGAALVARLPAAGRRVGRVVVRSLATAVALGAAVGGVLAVLVPGPAAAISAIRPATSTAMCAVAHHGRSRATTTPSNTAPAAHAAVAAATSSTPGHGDPQADPAGSGSNAVSVAAGPGTSTASTPPTAAPSATAVARLRTCLLYTSPSPRDS